MNEVNIKKMYAAWSAMKCRCRFHERYIKKGIVFCKRWDLFKNFYEDMSPTYSPGLTLDRINNDGNYEPSNCRWATYSQQNSNKSGVKLLELDGVKKTATAWSSIYGISDKLIKKVILSGVHPKDYKLKRKRWVTINGECKSLSQWSREKNISPQVLYYRLKTKTTAEELFKPTRKISKGEFIDEVPEFKRRVLA
jgi:hypothetical protein